MAVLDTLIEERYWNTDLLIDEEIEIEDDEGSPF
jgi:hypothetical protein